MRCWIVIAALAALVFLAGCASFSKSRIDYITPELVIYSDDEQRRAANELMKCDCEMVQIMLSDYAALRDAIRETNSQ